MYLVNAKVRGTSALLQHRFAIPELADMVKGGTRKSGAVDYTQEWKDHLYADKNGRIFQPAIHLESAMVQAAVNFKITGRRGKTYKDLFKAAVFVTPEEIPHGIEVPEELTTDADEPLYLDIRPVVVNRARVARIRPAFKPGWELEFDIQVTDSQIPLELLRDVLDLAGKTVGIGDYRPKFGRFMVTKFEVQS